MSGIVRAFIRFAHLVRDLLTPGAVEQDFDDELSSYVDLVTGERVRAGDDPVTARRAALQHVGDPNTVKARVRAERFTLRGLAERCLPPRVPDMMTRAPLTSAALGVLFASGIAANVAVFEVVETMTRRAKPGVTGAAAARSVAATRRSPAPLEASGAQADAPTVAAFIEDDTSERRSRGSSARHAGDTPAVLAAIRKHEADSASARVAAHLAATSVTETSPAAPPRVTTIPPPPL